MKKLSLFLAWICLLLVAGCKQIEVLGPDNPISTDDLSLLDSDLPVGGYKDLVFINDSTGFTVGDAGIIMKTTNTGKNWTKVNSLTTKSLTNVRFVNPKTGFSIGYDDTGGIILRTDNSGDTWQIYAEGKDIEPKSICFPDSSTGYILMGGNYLLKTVDAGKTWEKTLMNNLNYPVAINFKNAKEGIISALKGIYYSTKNGGLNWQKFETPIADHLYDIYYLNDITILKADAKIIIVDSNNQYRVQDTPTTLKLYFITQNQAVGVGYHYPESGFYPNGDIYLTNDLWKTWSNSTYGGSIALGFTAISKLSNHKVMMIGTGFKKAPVCILKL